MTRDMERFVAKHVVNPATGCWLWTDSLPKGYGRFRIGGTEVAAHRWSSRLEAQQETARLARREQDPLPPKSAPTPPATPAEAELAARLLPHVCRESVIDRERHALNVARSLFALGLGRSPAQKKEATDG